MTSDLNEAIFIGDIHGCFKTLQTLISQFPSNVPIVFVGDLIDRGPDSHNVVEFVKNNNHLCVMGNHEDMMILSLDSPETEKIWIMNGGDKALDSYPNREKKLEHIEWMKNLPIYIHFPNIKVEEREVVVSHSFLGKQWKNKDKPERNEYLKDYVLWGRTIPQPTYNDIFNVVGHTPNEEIRVKKHYANIDTGAVFKNKLTALMLPSLEIFVQENIEDN